MGKRASERARARESERESALLVGVAAEAYWRRLIMRFFGVLVALGQVAGQGEEDGRLWEIQ